MPNSSNIILVGPMGAGKSAVGRQLATKLNRQFHDSDHDIVARTGVDISFIFEKEGEEGFRKRETEALEHLCKKQNILLSTGGGSVISDVNRQLITNSGFVIYLHASVAQQAKRTKKKDNRPLLQADNPKKILERLMSEREILYRQVADLVVNTDSQKVPRVVDLIMHKLEELEQSDKTEFQNKVRVSTINREYTVTICNEDLLASSELNNLSTRSVVLITDENLDKLYREKLENLINPLAWLVVPASETSKSFDHYQWLLSQLLALGVKRDTVLLGLGGGVVGDLTGFVAATYMRGMQLIHMPTSLLAMVDSSLGGKTGINLPDGKNLVGSIYQPHAVISNLNFLKTLPEEEYISGLAEVLKYAFIYDKDLLRQLEENSDKIKHRDFSVMQQIIKRCVEIKAEIVEKDEQDHGLRMLLNFGHTFGHAIEKLQEYKGFKHGEAVAIGMCMAADLSQKLSHLSEQDSKRVKELINSFSLPTQWSDFSIDDFLTAMAGDKKNTSDMQRFILLQELGKGYVEESVSSSQLEKLLKKYQDHGTSKRQTA